MTQQRHRSAVRRLTISAVAALLLVVAPAACGDDDDGGASTTVGNVLPPVVADLASIDGTTVAVPVGGTVDLTGGGDAVTDWTGEIADDSIVSFVPGRDDGSATFNPGLEALAAGSTDVTMTNSSSGATVTFTVDVTEG